MGDDLTVWRHHATVLPDRSPSTGAACWWVVCTCGRDLGPFALEATADRTAVFHDNVHYLLDPNPSRACLPLVHCLHGGHDDDGAGHRLTADCLDPWKVT